MSARTGDLAGDLYALYYERGLTIAYRANCECARYFIERGDVLIPEVLMQAVSEGVDPVDVFARYARGVHARHESGLPILAAAS